MEKLSVIRYICIRIRKAEYIHVTYNVFLKFVNDKIHKKKE